MRFSLVLYGHEYAHDDLRLSDLEKLDDLPYGDGWQYVGFDCDGHADALPRSSLASF